MKQNNIPILIYRTADGLTKVNVTFDEDTVCLTQEQMVKSVTNKYNQLSFFEEELHTC